MNIPIATIVVPVYNTSQYLNQCVESLINQTLKDVEFIFVDDGSTDDSVKILQQYQGLDHRIKIKQQNNLFAGVARNHGMEEASGKYIIFLDSDDFFDLNMLKKTYDCAEKNHVEIVMFGYRQYDDSSKKITYQKQSLWNFYPKDVFSAEDLGDNIYSICNSAPWNKLFLREFINEHHLRFEALKKSNDTYFVHMAIALARRIIFMNKNFVNYRISNPNSLQGSRILDRRAFIESGLSVKKGLLKVEKYHGVIKESEIKYAHTLVNMGLQPPYSKETLEDYYSYAKEHLVPDLFDSPAEFENCFTAKNIYESSDFTDFLCRQLQDEKEDKEMNFVHKSNLDYRFGHQLLSIPKKLLEH